MHIEAEDLLRPLAEAELAQLRERYTRDRNFIFVWDAFELATRYQIPLPDWVVKHMRQTALEMRAVFNAALLGQGSEGAAHRILKAIGFSRGRGRRDALTAAIAERRDEAMFYDVLRAAIGGCKLDIAYDIVAEECVVHRSTVVRAAIRHLRRLKNFDHMTFGAFTMEECVRRHLDDLNETAILEADDAEEGTK